MHEFFLTKQTKDEVLIENNNPVLVYTATLCYCVNCRVIALSTGSILTEIIGQNMNNSQVNIFASL